MALYFLQLLTSILKAHLWESSSRNFKEIFPALVSLIYLYNMFYKSCKLYTCICNRTEVACQKLKKIKSRVFRSDYGGPIQTDVNSKSIWRIEHVHTKTVKFSGSLKMVTGKLLPFWPISNGMTQRKNQSGFYWSKRQ